MGAQIAAHLANAGVPTILLDIAPRELTPEEQAKGLTLESKEVRNRIARAGFEAARKAKPVLLEPIMKIDVTAPTEYQGAVMNTLSQRNAIVTNTETSDSYTTISAEVSMN